MTAPIPIGILLPRTELLDSPARMEFSTGSFHAVFIRLSMAFSSYREEIKVLCHCQCDLTASVMSLLQSRGRPPMAAIYFTVKFELPAL